MLYDADISPDENEYFGLIDLDDSDLNEFLIRYPQQIMDIFLLKLNNKLGTETLLVI